jgi:hypothetical protein
MTARRPMKPSGTPPLSRAIGEAFSDAVRHMADGHAPHTAVAKTIVGRRKIMAAKKAQQRKDKSAAKKTAVAEAKREVVTAKKVVRLATIALKAAEKALQRAKSRK